MDKQIPNIKNRFITGLSALILFSLILITIVIENSKSINKITLELIEHPYTVSNSIRDFSGNIFKINHSIATLIYTKDKKEIDRNITTIEENHKLNHQLFNVIKEKYLGSPDDVNNAFHAYSTWKATIDKIIELIEASEIEEAINYKESISAAKLNTLQNSIRIISQFADNKSKEYRNKSLDFLERGRKQNFAFIISSLFLGFLIFIWLYRSISIQLVSLSKRVQDISKKYLSKNIYTDKSNIIEILNLAIDDLEQTNKKLLAEKEEANTAKLELQNYMDNLEEIVKERSESLREANLLLEKAIDNAPIGMAMIDLELKYISVNQTFCEMLGCVPENILNTYFSDITYDDDKDKEIEIIHDILSGKMSKTSYEKRYIAKGGKLILTLVTLSLVVNDKNEPEYFFKQIQDVTEKRIAEKELNEYKVNLEKLINERTLELEQKNKELLEKNNELEKYNELFVGREFRIKELKEQIKKLEKSN